MTLQIHLPPEIEQKLLEQAAATGKEVATLVEEAVAAKFAAAIRSHDAFLNSYAAEDEGLYDDFGR
jgi:predicted transcriptional regulator